MQSENGDEVNPVFEFGNAALFDASRNTGSSKSVDKEVSAGMYASADRILTDTEKAMVDVLGTDLSHYIMPESVPEIAEAFLRTRDSQEPINSALFFGEAGGGKSMACKAIAWLRGIPYTSVTCFPEMEAYDFLVQAIPVDAASDSESKTKLRDNMNKILSDDKFMDLYMDPEKGYTELTGKNKPGATIVDCCLAAMELAGEELASGGQRFRYVDSELVKAVRYGWLCEIQEPTLISKPGVLGGLNSLLDSNGTLRLMTGEVLRRHKDCGIIMTTNISYEGCRDMNQSVLSRLGYAEEFEFPDSRTLKKWITERTELKDTEMIHKMVSCLNEFRKILASNGCTDGSLGVRELLKWVQLYMVNGDPVKSARKTVVAKATFDPDVRKMIDAALAKQFD